MGRVLGDVVVSRRIESKDKRKSEKIIRRTVRRNDSQQKNQGFVMPSVTYTPFTNSHTHAGPY